MVDSLDLGFGMDVMGFEGSVMVLAATTTVDAVRSAQPDSQGRWLTCVTVSGKVDCHLAADASRGADNQGDGLIRRTHDVRNFQ